MQRYSCSKKRFTTEPDCKNVRGYTHRGLTPQGDKCCFNAQQRMKRIDARRMKRQFLQEDPWFRSVVQYENELTAKKKLKKEKSKKAKRKKKPKSKKEKPKRKKKPKKKPKSKKEKALPHAKDDIVGKILGLQKYERAGCDVDRLIKGYACNKPEMYWKVYAKRDKILSKWGGTERERWLAVSKYEDIKRLDRPFINEFKDKLNMDIVDERKKDWLLSKRRGTIDKRWKNLSKSEDLINLNTSFIDRYENKLDIKKINERQKRRYLKKLGEMRKRLYIKYMPSDVEWRVIQKHEDNLTRSFKIKNEDWVDMYWVWSGDNILRQISAAFKYIV